MTERPLRIAFVYDALFPYVKGGAERRFHELARRLSARHDVHIVSWTWWDDAPDESLDGLTLHGVGKPPAMYGADGKRTVREAAAFSARVLPVLLRGKWDVIDCAATPYLPLWSTWLASRLVGARLTVTWHEFWGKHWRTYLPQRPIVAQLAMALESASRGLGDDIVAVSPFTANAMALPDGRVRVVPNGVAVSEINAAPTPRDASDVVYVGRLIDEKRVDLLVRAAGKLRARMPDLRYSIIGSGPMDAELQALSAELGLSDRITFHGQLDSDEAYGRLKAARLLVLPSIREGYGMAVAEAQAAGTVPIVVRSPTSAATDLVRDRRDGLVVDPTPAALAKAIGTLLGNEPRLTAMGRAAHAVGLERDWEQQAEAMEAVYRGQSGTARPPLSLPGWLALRLARLRQLARWRPHKADVERYLPLTVAVAIAVGLAAVAMLTPIAGRGDYGQWLMTSRFYLGEPIPGYRDVTALPPFVPLLLVFIRLMVPDPVVALEVLNGLLLAGLCVTFYLLGTTLLANRWAGVMAMVVGFLITDRFLELFAFGGLLQGASLMFMGLSVVAFVRASSAPRIERGWWIAGVLAMAMAVLSHVATGLIAVPVGLLAAGLAVLPRRDMGWRVLGRTLLPLAVGLLAVAAYWFVVLVPASTEYVTNPASLAYRGPDRLLASLFAYWPTSLAIVLGAVAIALGSLGELLQRRAGGYVVLLMWVAVTWGALAYSVVSGAATDYPRFSTLLLAPLVVGAAGAVMWLLSALFRYVGDLRPGASQAALALAAVLLLTVVSTPFAVQRYGRQSLVYQPRDAVALTAAAQWIDHALGGQAGAVLTDVRDGKWIEGITGREALFSLPVRYAFRPIEWRRTNDADALLRSTMALTSGLVTAMYTDQRVVDGASIPSDLLLRVNHGGEFVDLLSLNWAAIEVRTKRGRWIAANQLVPVRAVRSENLQAAKVTTVWGGSGPTISLVQRATVWKDGTALGVRLGARGDRLRARLEPPAGAQWTVSDFTGQEATVCLAPVGGTAPCARIWVGSGNALLSATTTGDLHVTSSDGDGIDLLMTALSAGKASVGLSLLDPASIVAERDVKAALLWSFDPAFADRVRRLSALGFRIAESIGPYQVLLRSAAIAGAAGGETP